MTAVLDWNEYTLLAREAAAEGCVLIKNDNNALPLEKGCRAAVFGRIQSHYYKSGTGSGGLVNVDKVYGIPDGLEEDGIVVNSKLRELYAEWISRNPYDEGDGGWGSEPWSQSEMPLDESLVKEIASDSDAAVVIIGRSAGEDKDSVNAAGSYLLTETEEAMLETVRRSFGRMIVVLNVGGIIDMSFVDKFNPDAVIYVWQGGMLGGLGAADVLTGKTNPSGKLTDTIAYSISDYPSDKYFGNRKRNFYSEDIYVGYRYFETFAKDKVRYPFGFGLSYTSFKLEALSFARNSSSVSVSVKVTNIGSRSGKEVVQLYVCSPMGRLGKPLRVLSAFAKTSELAPECSETITLEATDRDISSFDDSGCTGNKDCFVLEAGEYGFFVGSDVRSAVKCGSFALENTVVTERLSNALEPTMPFERIRPELCSDGCIKPSVDMVPTCAPEDEKRRTDNMPEDITYSGDTGLKLKDVSEGKCSMRDFIAQLSDYDLACMVRGEGMGSPKVTPGTAAAFGGVTDSLKSFGIPCACCTDGPSGMRLDCGTKAFSLPNGTLLASSYNTELIEKLFACLGLEMASNHIDCLLGPGMNIHRHPLNGRNFEYLSEDPLVTGKMSVAMLKGMKSAGVTGTIKHFSGNNQETVRRDIDSVISSRALREIYLRGFEIAVKEGGADSVMTTYGSLNGIWTAGSYDLVTTVLRNEWGFRGIVMTDWWAAISRRGGYPCFDDFAQMVRAQGDIYMVCSDSSAGNDNLEASLADDTLTRGELQKCAENICGFILNSRAMKRFYGNDNETEIINRPYESRSYSAGEVDFELCDNEYEASLEHIDVKRGESYVFGLDVTKQGYYDVTITASSESGALAQIPVSLYVLGSISGVFTWNGTGGKPVAITKNKVQMLSRFSTVRLYFGQGGIKLHSIRFSFIKPL